MSNQFDEAAKAVNSALRMLSMSTAGLSPTESVALAVELAALQETLAEYQDEVKARLLKLANERGEVVTEKGSKELKLGPYKIRSQPTRTGYDPKKVLALLRAKGLDPDVHMAVSKTYAIDEAKTLLILRDDELDTCKYDGAKRTLHITWVGQQEEKKDD